MPPHPLTNFEMQKYYQNEPKFNDITNILKPSFKKLFRYFEQKNHHLNDFKMHRFVHYFLPPSQADLLICIAIISSFGNNYLLLRRFLLYPQKFWIN